MATDRRIIAVASGLLAAVALSACAPQGSQYSGGDYGAGAPQAAGAEVDVTADPSEGPVADPIDGEEEGDTGGENGVSAGDITTSLTGTKVARMGRVVKDQDGRILYRFDKDDNNPAKSNCDGKCAEVWPPALTEDGSEPAIEGISEDLVGTVERNDGTQQLTIDGWPLYTYIGDVKAGQWKGQAVGNTWFVIRPNGKKNLTCLPKTPPKAVEPPSNADEGYSDGVAASPAPDDGSGY